MDTGATSALIEHGVLGALVVLQFGIILWLITKLTTKVNGQATRIDRVERYIVESEEENDT